jgi:hypothetical protein
MHTISLKVSDAIEPALVKARHVLDRFNDLSVYCRPCLAKPPAMQQVRNV